MIGFCPLASGSKGNALFLGSPKTKILVDIGLSFTQLEQRLSQINISIDEIEAILITHDHTDHISGIKMVADKKIKILANSDTAKAICQTIDFIPNFKIFTTNEPFNFKDLHIKPFSIPHDTLDPVGFTITLDCIKIGICTDIGFVNTLVQKELSLCDYLYIEANHKISMVHSSPRPSIYKQRVLGRQGHLSNEEAALLISNVHHEKLKHVYLAHLSSECNSPIIAKETVSNHLLSQGKKVNLSVASQETISNSIIF